MATALPPTDPKDRFILWMKSQHEENCCLRFAEVKTILETWVSKSGAKDYLCKLIRTGELKSLQLTGTTATRYSRGHVETLVLDHIERAT